MAKYVDLEGLNYNNSKMKQWVDTWTLNNFAKLDAGRNYAKGTGNALRFDQTELGSSANADANTGNCFIYPISGLNQGDVVTVSFDWYYKDEDGIDSAFSQYGNDTGNTSFDVRFTISMGIEYGYGGGGFVAKSNYEQYKISDTEIKGHCSMNVSINTGDVNTVSYPYIQNQFIGVAGGNHYLEISNFMVVKGDREMSWTPAPEDSQWFTYAVDYPSTSAPRTKIMPGMYNILNKGAATSTINCGLRQLASTNKTTPEYIFEWLSGTSGTTLVLPSNIKWMNGDVPTFEANKKYQVSIVNNLAVAAAF